MNTIELLTSARNLIADPEHWTQRAFARDGFGNSIGPTADSACSWCSLGALTKSFGNIWWPESHCEPLEQAIGQLHPDNLMSLADFNDSHTHQEVLAVFDKAIENANNS